MKRLLFFCMVLILTPSLVVAGGIRLRYGFAPGQKWECTQKTQMTFEVMGKTHVQRQKYTILYTVTKGPKKNWVRLIAQYINPPPRTPENQYTLGQYDLIFSADVHTSGDTRNIQVQGTEKPNNDPSIPPQHKMALVQTNKMLAQSLQPDVFWFPELPEDPLKAGDEFEEKRTHDVKDPSMNTRSKTRTVFTLDNIIEDLAYFETKERLSSKMITQGGKMDFASSGKGEIIFDLKKGMWIEFVSKSKMKFSGGMVGLNDQEMLMIKKITMQRK